MDIERQIKHQLRAKKFSSIEKTPRTASVAFDGLGFFALKMLAVNDLPTFVVRSNLLVKDKIKIMLMSLDCKKAF